ncbi:MAG: Tm-1-like ATP-binding domain-containing protein [Candidatus Latescibacterota bacterium]|nr:Tm-1-like ATP-binding domain-containing protein [Candidatus Latescibacterota bacterium]
MATIMMIGSFDTKGIEYAFLHGEIVRFGHNVVSVDTSVVGNPKGVTVDISAEEIAGAAGRTLQELRDLNDRGKAMAAMADGAAAMAKRLHDSKAIEGIIGMGGSGGSSVVTSAMRALPIGIPKVCVSTVASGDTSAFVGDKDVVMIPSIVDVAGINRISRIVISRAAGAICGMVSHAPPVVEDKRRVIAASMFGNTTECVNTCVELLESRGFEVLVFHATGSGGRTMESLIGDGLVDGVLDITTTEWADELCGGIFSAGPNRLTAAGVKGVPQVVVPGCIDMVNFGGLETVPSRYRDANRLLYEWNPAVTLMRTNVEENKKLGDIFSEKLNLSCGPVACLLPQRGISILDGDGELFCDRAADAAFATELKKKLRSDICIEELDYNINHPVFAARAVEVLLELMTC